MALQPAAAVAILLFCLLALSNATTCPPDSVATDDGECKCVSPCLKQDCQPGLQPVRVKEAIPETPGLCCPLYECYPPVTLSYEPEKSNQCYDGSGQPRDNGDTWHEADPCTSCHCENGSTSCHTTMCRSCEHPMPRVPGECCPRCASPETSCPKLSDECKLLDCELGLDMDDNGCRICKCRTRDQNEVTSEEDEDEDDVKDDEILDEDDDDDDDEEEDEDCSESQKSCNLNCEWGLLKNSKGCPFCQCKLRQDCPSVIDCKLKCPQGFAVDKYGCLSCRCLDSCLDERNVTRPEGSRWRSDYCRSCSCELGGRIFCNETICAVACSNPLPPPPGQCCPVCSNSAFEQWHGWGTLPIILIVSLALLCVLLMVHLVRGRFRGRLVPSEADFMGFPHHHQQYYKCVPVYETHVPVLQQAEKIVPL